MPNGKAGREREAHQVGVLQVAVQHLVDLQQGQPAEQLAQVALDLGAGFGGGVGTGRQRLAGVSAVGMHRAVRCEAPKARGDTSRRTAAAEERRGNHNLQAAGAGRTCAALKGRFSRLVRSSRPVMSWSM